jgi:FtsH-binding integral membrane protein
MTSSDRSAEHRFRGRLFLLLGVGCAVLGILAYVVQIALEQLMAPWYVPALAMLGGLLVVMSLREKRTVWRVRALIAVALIAVAEGGMIYASRLPPYTGPIALGRPMPLFATARADGSMFTQADLPGDRNSVLVFFRGRW